MSVNPKGSNCATNSGPNAPLSHSRRRTAISGGNPCRGQFAGNKMNRNIRYALLAGTVLLPVIAAPQAGKAADSVSAASTEPLIMLAQAPAIDPATGKPYPKG